MVIWIITASVLSGIVAGMGMGGGTVLIPVLTILFDYAQKNAQAINLLAFLPTAIIALIIHFKNGLVDIKNSIWIISSGVIFSVLGSYIATYLKSRVLQVCFGIFLLAVGVFQFVTIFLPLGNKKDNTTILKIKIGSYKDIK